MHSQDDSWWVPILDQTLGWVASAVENREVAVPAPRAQIVRLAALVDNNALCWMAEKELFGHVDAIVCKLTNLSPKAIPASGSSAGQGYVFQSQRMSERCAALLRGIRQIITSPVVSTPE